jgi:hypothetical protein
MEEVIRDKYMYLTYYAYLVGIKQEVLECKNARCGKLQNKTDMFEALGNTHSL